MNATSVKVVRRVDKEGNYETFDVMLKRFRKLYQESGLLQDMRKHEFAMSPSQKRKIKREQAEKRRRKEEAKEQKYYRLEKEL